MDDGIECSICIGLMTSGKRGGLPVRLIETYIDHLIERHGMSADKKDELNMLLQASLKGNG